jgi:hypothetical protein
VVVLNSRLHAHYQAVLSVQKQEEEEEEQQQQQQK